MSYQKLNLQNGQVLDAEHLAHIEDALDQAFGSINTNTNEINILKNSKVQLESRTTEEWEEIKDTYILLKGEPGVEFTTENITKMKIGDGKSTWAQLPYITSSSISDTVIDGICGRQS